MLNFVENVEKKITKLKTYTRKSKHMGTFFMSPYLH